MATTTKRIYQLALAKLAEAPGGDTDYDAYAPLLLDGLLVEALPYENACRRAKGTAEMTGAPEITAIDDATVLDWNDRITRVALPEGLAAAILLLDDGKQAESVMHRNEFLQALENAAPATFETPSDWEEAEE